MPTPTDLVTDLPADFEVFGQAVDTSLADLKGGTTDQVLAKNSNTDMDFKWVTSDDANAIQNSIVDAKGDLIAASANDTPARLAVGNNGEQIVADSSASVGLRYSATPSASNPVLNSAMQVWQRGTSIVPTSNSYVADRWYSFANSAATASRQNTNDTTNLPSIQYCLRMQRTAGSTSVVAFVLSQSMETINSIPFAGKTVTLSLYARRGANYSATSNFMGFRLWSGTGTDENQASYTGAAIPLDGSATLTTTWQRFTVTGTVATSATEIAVQIYGTPTGTAGAADFFEVTGVQLDVGSVALPYRTNAGTFQGELSACQRYYYRNASGRAYGHIAFGMAYLTTGASFNVVLPVTMRATPSSIEFANLQVNQPGTGGSTVTTLTYSQIESSFNFANVAATGLSGLTQYRPYYLINDNNINGYFAASAEL